MEQNAIQWLGAPCCLRGSFAFYKSFSSRNEPSRQATVWKLGEFYFVRCAPQEPACIAELTLLWEDRVQRHKLASSRLYFLPEDTPEGRRVGEHGEDEVLAVSKKVVVRVEDLVRWACPEPMGWRAGGGDINWDGGQNGCSVSWGVPGTTGVDSGARRQVKVLSYPQYCRFRSLQRRIQDRAGGPDLLNPHLLALGGLRAASHHTRILYCRDTFNHPTLDSNASVWNQLGSPSLSVKGRPRKRRGRDVKGVESQSCGQSVVSWMDKMKESVMGSVEVPWEGGWLPRPEEQHFLDDLYHFMESRGSPISKVPNLGFKKIDLFLLYSTVKKLGGYGRVTSQRLWKRVYNELGGSPGSTSAATCTRRHYEKLMLAYEQHLTGEDREKEISMTQVPVSSSSSSETHKGQVTEVAERSVNGAECREVRAPARGAEVRRRGRPPNRRHVRGVGKAPASSSPAQPPNRESLQNAPPPRPKDGSLQSVSVVQQLRSPSAQEPCFSSSSHPTLCQHTDFHQGDKVKQPAVPASPPPLQAIKTEPGEPLNLCPTGALGGLCFPKGLHPLALFRARLGVGDAEHPGSECASSLQPPVLLVQTGAGPTDERGGPPPPSTHNLTGVCDCRSKSALPPLRIIPLGIDCSLQVRQLMRSRVGPSELSSFTRKLSEVLAQDLSKACRPSCLQQGASEQPAPLNLSKQAPAKRLGDDAEGSPSAAKRMTMDWASLSAAQLGLKLNTPVGLFQEIQEEPADLSSPKRARASAQERAGQPAAAPRVAGGLALQPESPPGAQVPVDHIKMEDHAGNPQGQPADTTGVGVLEAAPGTLSWEMPSTLGRQLGSLQAQSQACWSLPDHVCLETRSLTPYH